MKGWLYRAVLCIVCMAVMDSGSAMAADCNGNAIDDVLDISGGTSEDCNSNGVPDECDLVDTSQQAKFVDTNGSALAFYGFSVAIDGDTALVGSQGSDDACGGGPMCNSGSAFVYVFDGSTWTEQAELLASDGAAGDSFGFSVSLSGDTALVGSPNDDDLGGQSGSAYVFVRTGGVWTQQQKLVASDGAASDSFGVSVSLDGDTAVIGSPYDDDGGDGSGSAYVFVRDGGVWTEQTKLAASDAAGGDEFGWSVSLSGDTAVVGAHFDDDACANCNSGSAYVFVRTGTVWSEQDKLVADDDESGDEFGFAVAVSGDTAIVGAFRDDDACANCDSGSAYAFLRTGTSWSQQAKLTASDAGLGHEFGRAVTIDGNSAIIGARHYSIPSDYTGSAYVFTREGALWTEQENLQGSDTAGGDTFGISVAIDGVTVIAGAIGDDDVSSQSGAAYVFALPSADCNGNDIPDECEADCDGDGIADECEIAAGTSADCNTNGLPDDCEADCDDNGIPDDCEFAAGTAFDCDSNGIPDVCDIAAGSSADCNGNGTPDACDIAATVQGAKLHASDAGLSDQFGSAVAISGNTAIVGSATDDYGATQSAGSAYIYVRDGGVWTEQAKLISSDPDWEDYFGSSVAIDGDTVVIGARHDEEAPPVNQGAAFVFVRTGDSWTQQAKLIADDSGGEFYLGATVAIQGDTVIAGSPGSSFSANAAGAAYVFVRSGVVWTQQAKLTASDGEDGDGFGSSISFDGDTAVIGAWGDEDEGNNTGAAYVFTRSGTIWTEQAKLLASDAASNDYFGFSVAISGGTILVGSRSENYIGATWAFNAGAVYVFDGAGSTWTQTAKFRPDDFESNDLFGYTVALDGGVAVITSNGDDDLAPEAGAAYVFIRTGDTWNQSAKITADVPDMTNGAFGQSLAVDGDTAIVGSRLDDVMGENSGAAFIFDLQTSLDCNTNANPDECDIAAGTSDDCNASGIPDECEADCNVNAIPDDCDIAAGTSTDCNADGVPDECGFPVGTFIDCNSNSVPDVCDISGGTSDDCNTNALPDECDIVEIIEQAKLKASDPAYDDQFGWAVAISGDTALIGAQTANTGPLSNTGAAYVFVRTDGVWTQQTKLVDPDPVNDDRFGYSVALDGDTAAVGCHSDDNTGPSSSSGSVFVFVRSGGVWTLEQKVTADDATSGDQFGWSVSIEGDTLVAGALTDDVPHNATGSAYVFERSGGVWTQQQKLVAVDAATNGYFGYSASLSGDTAVIGAEGDNDETGAAYVFVNTGGVWTQQAKLTASDGATGDGFGATISVDGDTVISGAFGDADVGYATGSAYVFERTGGIWMEQAKLTSDDPMTQDFFGYAVSVSGDTAVVGAIRDGDFCPDCNAGSVYVFTRSGGVWTLDDELLAFDAATNGFFGASVHMSGGSVIVGAISDDELELNSGAAYVFELPSADCNLNGSPDECDVAFGSSMDCNSNGVPDICDVDCNTNGVPDDCDIETGASSDCNLDGVPDSCYLTFDLADYAAFTLCFGSTDPACLDAFDVAEPCGIVDLTDYSVLASAMTGP